MSFLATLVLLLASLMPAPPVEPYNPWIVESDAFVARMTGVEVTVERNAAPQHCWCVIYTIEWFSEDEKGSQDFWICDPEDVEGLKLNVILVGAYGGTVTSVKRTGVGYNC